MMLRLYTYLYAWAYLRSERQWGRATDHGWHALMSVTLLLVLNLAVAATVAAKVFENDVSQISKSGFRVIAILAACVAAIINWLLIQRSGRGPRLVEQLRKVTPEAQRRGERMLMSYVVGSMVLLMASWIGYALL